MSTTPQDLIIDREDLLKPITLPDDKKRDRGWGFNRHLYKIALALAHQGYGKDQILTCFLDSPDLVALAKPGELERQVEEAHRSADPTAPKRVALPRAQFKEEMTMSYAKKHPEGVSELESLSPVPDAETRDVVQVMFPDPETWICCGKKTLTKLGYPTYIQHCYQQRWWLRESALENMEFLVPNPMKGKEARVSPTLDRVSPRCNANVLKREYVVYESDFLSLNIQAGLLIELEAATKRLVVATHSGAKSIHGYFYVGDLSEEDSLAFFNKLIERGADEADRTLCQFARMPGGVRDGGVRQRILYFNPNYGY